MLVLSGSVTAAIGNNAVPQVWRDGRWIELTGPGQSFDLYPRMHVMSTGLLCWTGSLKSTWTVDISTRYGSWKQIAGEGRPTGLRDYCPSVMYDVDKVVYIGGGNAPDSEGFVPTAEADMIDLSQPEPRWKPAGRMNLPRRQHNATILPDGTVLVTGGSRGGGGPGNGFNDLTRGKPARVAELWDPATETWTELAAEQFDRCYHSTAVLLTDATVLSAGSGEYAPWPGSGEDNFPEDNHRNGQVFMPPYLFKGERPEITDAPDGVSHGQQFAVETPQVANIAKVSLVRLTSVTHSFNANQRINFPTFTVVGGALLVTAPESPNACPSGHYMLFILSTEGVPSVARIMTVGPTVGAPYIYATGTEVGAETRSVSVPPEDATFMTSLGKRWAVHVVAQGTRVVVGLTGRCPYGIGACWGGAEEALRSLAGVQHVDPIPDARNSTATVFLEDDRLPDLRQWDEDFKRIANGSYDLQGVEVSLAGTIEARNGEVFLATPRQSVRLAALARAEKVHWDFRAGAPKALRPSEASAYDELASAARSTSALGATVTGSLEQAADDYVLHVRRFSVEQTPSGPA